MNFYHVGDSAAAGFTRKLLALPPLRILRFPSPDGDNIHTLMANSALKSVAIPLHSGKHWLSVLNIAHIFKSAKLVAFF